MLTFTDKSIQIDSQLEAMAKAIQLDKRRYEKMITSYEAIKEWIESDEIFFKPYKYEVYPQGSVRIFTTVKPIFRDEFDLDIVIHFKDSLMIHNPSRIYAELKRRLSEHKTYKKILEPKSRVLRLNYSGDFHLDIMAGVQESAYDSDVIKVPDKALGRWVISNPRGYADWFLERANLVSYSSAIGKALVAEDIQDDNYFNKKPLQRAVQLLKRYRDVFFNDYGSAYKTKSIIITTLAGQLYEGEESIFDTIDNILTRVKNDFKQPLRMKVYNPINPKEDFTDKWDNEPKYYEAFKKFIGHLYFDWQKLKQETGVIEEAKLLKGLFGSKLVEAIHLNEIDSVESLRHSNNLKVNANNGMLVSTGLAPKNSPSVKNNTFFGN